jgi:hypothetical protein
LEFKLPILAVLEADVEVEESGIPYVNDEWVLLP